MKNTKARTHSFSSDLLDFKVGTSKWNSKFCCHILYKVVLLNNGFVFQDHLKSENITENFPEIILQF